MIDLLTFTLIESMCIYIMMLHIQVKPPHTLPLLIIKPGVPGFLKLLWCGCQYGATCFVLATVMCKTLDIL